MGKNKKIYRILIIIFLTLLVLVTAVYFTLKSPSTQTWLFHRFATKFSGNNEVELLANNIKFTFFNKIEVSNLLIKDNTEDTLIYAPKLTAGIRKIKRKERFIGLGQVNMENPVIKFRPDTNNILNISYFAQFLVNKDTAKRNKDLIIRQINIENGTFEYHSGKETGQQNENFDINNISLKGLNANIKNLNKHYGNIDLRISELSFESGRDFAVENMFADLSINDSIYRLTDPTIRTSHSFINSDIIGIELLKDGKDFSFVDDARISFNLQSSLISMSDLSYFIKPVKGFSKEIILSGKINGTVNELNGRDIIVSYSDSTMLLCDFDMSGLPDIDNTFMFIRVGSLTTTAHEISDFEIPGKGRLNTGNEFNRLGAMSFSGNFTGFIKDFVTYGTINTELGSVSTDILFRPDTSGTFHYAGTLRANSVKLGQILNREDILGTVTAHIDVEGTSTSFRNFRAEIESTIDSIEFLDYNYRDISIEGLMTEKIWDGTVSSSTDDLKMDLLGRLDFTGSIPEVDFSFNLLHADLYKLNIDKADSLSNLSMLLTASFKGNNINNLNGDIRLLNTRINKNGREFNMYDGSISAFLKDSTTQGLSLRTDFVDADIDGRYDITGLIPAVQYAGSKLFPSLFLKKNTGYESDNNFKYTFRFKNTDNINELLETGLNIAPGTIINGSFDNGHNIILSAEGDYLLYKSNSLVDYKLNCSLIDTNLILDLKTDRLSLADRLHLDGFSIESGAHNDNFNLSVEWDDDTETENYGRLMAQGSITASDTSRPKLSLSVLPTEITFNGNPWKIDSSTLVVDSSAVSIDHLLASRDDKYFMIKGKLSENPADSIFISFNDLDLAGLNNLNRSQAGDDSKETEFILEGLLSGEIMLTSIYDNPMFETDISVDNFITNGHEHGNVQLLSEWDYLNKVARINIRNNLDGANTFIVEGDYNPENKNMSLGATVNRMPLDILNIFLKSFASDVKGYGSGKVRINGDQGNISVAGGIFADDASMTIDYLQTNFRFSDSILFDNNRILFDNILISDNRDNKATISGNVTHSSFNDIAVDLRIDADNILVMDTRQKDNGLFYGTAYASGLITINGPANDLDLNISARTERNTRMFIPLSEGEEIDNYTFISFREPGNDPDLKKMVQLPALIKDNSKNNISLNFELEVTPDAEVQLVFDSKLGDVMKARGAGTLNMALNEQGDFTISGDYVIEDGEYQLTLGNIFNKRFIVENGGTISWNGDIMDASVDIKAIYKLKASLEDLFQDEAYAERIPVECHLNMSGQLVNPVIGFDIYLPTADESMRTDLRTAIDSEEEMSRQFLYLLVMNSFYPDPAIAGSSINTTNAGASAMGVTTTEMLSNQLSNWLSQISNDFDIGFTYRPGNEISSQELEVALSTQLLNDRVVINGNFDVGGQQSSAATNEITGDFDVEVKLTEKLRFKVFNRSNDNLVYERAPYTQGFGLFFRESFNNLGDLFRREKSKMKREEETKIIDE